MQTHEECPYCREDVKAGAVLCRYCRSTLRVDRRVMMMSAALQGLTEAAVQLDPSRLPQLPPANLSTCKIACHSKHGGSNPALQECLDNCDAVAMIRKIAERLVEELIISFEDIIWGSGDIDPLPDDFDPVPFEEAVRDRFNRPRR